MKIPILEMENTLDSVVQMKSGIPIIFMAYNSQVSISYGYLIISSTYFILFLLEIIRYNFFFIPYYDSRYWNFYFN